MQIFYLLMFIISFAMISPLLILFKKNTSMYYTLFFICVAIENLGTMQMGAASTLESAVFANQTIYMGACFLPYFSLMCVADLCNYEPKKPFKVACIALSIFIFVCVSTIGTGTLYYRSIELGHYGGVSYLIKEYGPLHTLYPAYIVGMYICGIGIILSSLKKKRMISYITSTTMLCILLITVAIYIVERVFHSPLEFLPLGFVIEQAGILVLLDRARNYDLAAISGETMTQSKEYGFVVLTAKGRFAGADEAARIWFPELCDLIIDYPIKNASTPFLQQLCQWADQEKEAVTTFECGSRTIEAKHRFAAVGGDKKIHCIYLSDYTRQNRYLRLMKSYNKTLGQQVDEKTGRLREVQNDIIISMASIVENRDNNTGGHIKRTSDIVKIFVAHLMEKGDFPELDEKTADCIVKAAPLHDFGKIAIPDIILNKPGKFTDDEYAQMKLHSEKGAVIVERILQNSDDRRFKRIAVNVAHYHHEKWDGSGYPSGLKGTDIPFEARVMALADVFDALVSKRVYKESFGYDKAFFIIEDSCGTHFDPRLCKAFLECRPQLEKLYDSYID